jgi:hypothetical protein
MKPRRHPKDTDGIFHAFTSGKVAALGPKTHWLRVRSGIVSNFLSIRPARFQRRSVIGNEEHPEHRPGLFAVGMLGPE